MKCDLLRYIEKLKMAEPTSPESYYFYIRMESFIRENSDSLPRRY